MPDQQAQERYRRYLQGELQGAAIYQALAEVERDPERAEVFGNLAQAEMRHARNWARKMGLDADGLKPANRRPAVLLLKLVARLFGTQRVMPMLLRGESEDIRTYAADPEALDIAKEERGHGRELRTLAGIREPREVVRAEGGHTASGGGSLRAAVLGVNDGLASNFALVMGVAGGTNDPDLVLLVGVAGLLAGGRSMAAGEYVSMRSQRDVFEHQIELERIELEQWPEEEQAELVLLYQAKGLGRAQATAVAARIMENPEAALDTLAREELGLDPAGLGSPWRASGSSFLAFVAGAAVPVAPYVLDAGRLAFGLSAALSATALLVVGGLLAVLSGRGVARGALRMLLVGSAAAAVTFAIGSLIGGALLG